ncbi:MAG: AAA family ATPase [Burkholderiaceae bacterium]
MRPEPDPPPIPAPTPEAIAAGAPPAGTWRLRLAGPPTLQTDTGPALVLDRRDALLLAYLAVEGPTPRARLLQLLWPDDDAALLRNRLRQRLFTLKRRLGMEPVVGQQLLQLGQALHYVAEDDDDERAFCGDLRMPESEELDAWLDGQRRARQARQRERLAAEAARCEQEGRLAEAIALSERLLAFEPLQEHAHRRLMRLHYLRGDRAAALLAFDRCERWLKDEVGARPGPETLALLATIERAEPTQAPAAAAAAVRRPVPAGVLRPPRLIGRSDAWHELEEAWEARRPVLVVGEGGMGKSRLLADFVAARPCGAASVAVVSARPGDQPLPYAVLTRLLRVLLRRPGPALPAGVTHELARLLPEQGEAEPIRGTAGLARFVAALETLMEQVAGAGLEGIVLDDLHFADEASLEALLRLAHRRELRWILAYRGEEVSAATRAAAAEMVSSLGAREQALLPLTPEQVRELLDSLGVAGLDAAALAGELHQRSGGNPLYLLELLKTRLSGAADGWPLSEGLRQLIGRRLARLSPDALHLLHCAAVAGPWFSAELAGQLMGRPTVALADAWAELQDAQVLRDGAFVHDLIHEAALAAVPAPVAMQLHAEVSRHLQAQGAPPAQQAEHADLGGDWARAGPAWLQAGLRARAQGRFLDAAQLMQRAIDAAQRCRDAALLAQAHRELAHARLAHSPDEEVGRHIQAALEGAPTDADRLDALLLQLDYLTHRGDHAPAIACAQALGGLAQRLGRVDAAFKAVSLFAQLSARAGRSAEGLAALDDIAPQVEARALPSETSELYGVRGILLARLDRLTEGAQALQQACARSALAHDDTEHASMVINLASVQHRMGHTERAIDTARQAIALMAGSDDAPASSHVRQKEAFLAELLRIVGRYQEALDRCQRLIAAFDAEGSGYWALRVRMTLTQLWQDLGQPARARRVTDGLEPPLDLATRFHLLRADLAPRGSPVHLAEAARAEVTAAASGEPALGHAVALVLAKGIDAYHAALHYAVATEQRGLELDALVRLAQAERQAGRVDVAAAHAGAALALSAVCHGTNVPRGEVWAALLPALPNAGDAPAGAAEAARRWLDRVWAHTPVAYRRSLIGERQAALVAALRWAPPG